MFSVGNVFGRSTVSTCTFSAGASTGGGSSFLTLFWESTGNIEFLSAVRADFRKRRKTLSADRTALQMESRRNIVITTVAVGEKRSVLR